MPANLIKILNKKIPTSWGRLGYHKQKDGSFNLTHAAKGSRRYGSLAWFRDDDEIKDYLRGMLAGVRIFKPDKTIYDRARKRNCGRG